MKIKVHHLLSLWWTLFLSLLATLLIVATLPATSGAVTSVTSGSTVTDTYGYTGATETLTIPSDVTSISLTILGAEGGRGGRDSSGTAPLGGYQGEVTGTLAVTPGQVLTIGVGQGGADSPDWNACTAGSNYALGDPLDAVGGSNPLGGYSGGNGGSPGPSGCSGYGGSGGAASVVEVGTSVAPSSAAVLVAGGSGGSGGSGQFSPTLGQISLPTYQARPDLTSTTGQYGESVYTACHQVTGQQCDGGGGAGGGGGAQGGSAGLVEFGSGTSDEWFGLGGYPGENDTNSLPGLTSQYVYYADDNSNGSVVISYSTGVPAAPTGVYGSPGNASASLYWSAPASSSSIPTPTGYVVQYATSPYSSWTTTSSCTGTSTTCTVTGLTNGTPYEFEVAAVNTNGQGQFSAPSSSVTPSGPPGAPNISGIVPSDGSLIVSFSGASSSLPISTYQYSLDGGSTWNPGGVTSSPLTIAGLTNGTQYSVEVRAVNGVGAGAASAPVTATPSALPGEPTITSITPGGDGTSLSVTFLPGYVGGSPIIGYDYATSLDANTSNFGAWTAVTGTTSPFVITGLASGSTYSVELRAINSVGPGPGSPYVNGVTLAVPDQPTITSVTPGNSSLQVTYAPYSSATDGGSPISGIDYSLDGGTTWTSAGTLADPFTIASLNNGTTYGVMLRADNGVGSSVVSSSVNGTPLTIPGAPSQVQVLSAPGAAQVSWSPPSSTGGSPITSYTASAFVATTGGAAFATCTSTSTSCQISGLTNDVNYYIEVVATNAAGPGAASSPRVSALPAALPGAPTISTLTAGNSYLAVPFSAGTFDTNAPITGYQYSTDGGNTWANASGTSSPIVISGLNNGTTYTVELRAVSAIGSGASSNSKTGTPYAAPDPTANATTSYTAGSQQVTVSWLAPNNNGAAISSYTVTAFTAAISGSQASTCTTSTLSCTLSGLTNGTTYYISIQSVNVYTQYSLRSSPRIPVLPGTPSTTTLTANPTSSSYGTSVTLNAAITSGATGTVAFSVNGSGISGCSAVTVTSSNAQCVTTALPVGSDTLSAAYSGDSGHASSSGTDSFNVGAANQAALTLTTTSTNYAPSPANTATLATSGGTTGAGVTYVISPSANSAGCSISGATLTYTSSGSCQVTATMAGNANYNPVSSPATTFNVNSTSSTTTLTANPTSSSYGTSVTLNAAITSGATGTVAFSVNGSGISGCSAVTVTSSNAQCVTTALPVGSDTLSAAYSGDSGHASSSGTDSFNVGAANQAALTLTTTSTNYAPSPANTATLATSGGTTGAGVTYVISPSANSAGCSISGATLTYTSSGSCQVTATMAGNANYNPVSSPATTFNVGAANQAALTLTTTSTNYAPSPANTATLATSGGTTGAGVTYVISPSANSAGCSISGATLTYTSSGSCQVTATMAGNANYNPVSSPATTFNVGAANQAALTLTTTSTNYAPSPANTATLATSGGTTGAGVTYVISPSANSAGCSISGATLTYTSSGSCQVTATMAGNANYNPVSSPATTFNVGAANQAALTLTTTSTNYAPSPANTATLATSGGTTGAGVTYVISPSANSAGCSISGATLTYTSSGSCQVTATMAGNANYNPVSSPATTFNVNSTSSTTTLTANPTSSSYGTSVTLNAAITSGATGTVAFSVNGSGISGCSSVTVTSSNAQCVTTALPVGSDTLRASYSGDVNNNPSVSGYVVFSVVANQPSAPRNVSAQVSGTSATVSWSPPTKSGTSSIVKYVVTASPGGASCTTSGATHCVMSGLKADVSYTFSVVAFNRQGASQPGNSHVKISKTVLSAPRAPTVSITNRSARVSWTAPASDGGTSITRYVVTASPGGASCTTSGAPHCVISGLQTGTTYTFSVVAHNHRDASPKVSTSDAVLTLPTVAVNAGVAVASWPASSLNGADSSNYRVSLIPGTIDCATVNTTTCTLVGVPNVKRYQVTLELLNASGRVLSIVTGTVQEVVLMQAYFDLDSYALSPAMQAKIINLAKEMVKDHMPALTIYGHADSSGSLVANLALSRERAQAVASFLYEELHLLGDTSVRLHVVGGGVSTASTLYSLDRNAIVVTSTHQVIALFRLAT